ncbi:hypothetical protein, variant [Phytophthora nicotianae INRA-310]|uniref:RING-type domain-containing protein n=1 Tax=Phytophthora nicotianae (strain INRA-310) TaxID=761204 RepID=W2PGP6_PHYN3|nr:hypothetical protein PPTG_18212 [Phytophthora nicotianae INRA-310]XP_008914419.1 hypothetical protein, variant [Phytophthora nicotianae INRA-310]ETN00212.1 hypothetical protein PPTG_18212 [Phytophthora nicotianae INRA-310]ETN00213.1 hypothetical protein, variant [Phytophthora nicotianae INRA-310]
MRSPSNTSESRSPPRVDGVAASTNQQEEHDVQSSASVQPSQDKAESDEEHDTQVHIPVPTRPAPHEPGSEPRTKRMWRAGSRQQLLERTRNRIRRSSLQQPLDTGGGAAEVATAPSARSVSPQGDFAEEIESEAAEIRTLIARTAELWSAVDRAEHAEDLPPMPQLRSFSASALHPSLPAQYECVEEDDSTLSSDNEEDEDENTETESVTDMTLSSEANEPLRHPNSVESDGRDVVEGLQLEQGEIMDPSNRAINAAKARAIKNAMLGNLLRLGFRENITRAALEAGVLEIDHYDSDCELAYVDIFMSLVKMVTDAHVDVVNGENLEQNWAESEAVDANAAYNLEQRSFLPFKWPVFDMAQFEFGNARAGTCFNSVCVLTNLPKVSMDRTEELMEILSCNLFCMIGDPIQVVIPSASSSGRTKGHAFLEFDDPDMAKRCAMAIDGLTWGRGPFGRIRGNLFRQYQVKSPAEEQRQTQDYVNDDGASFSQSFAVSGSLPAQNPPRNRIAERFRPREDVAEQHNLLSDSDEDSDAEWVVSRPLEYSQFNPSPLDLSAGSVDMREQFEPVQHDGITMHLGWENEALDDGYSSEDDDNDASFDSSSALELQAPDEEKLMDQSIFDELVQDSSYNDSRCSAASGEAQASTATSTASAAALEALAESGMAEQHWDVQEGDDAEKPWRRYCEDLIVRNREMQEQVAFARRRILQLSHNNQKLHLLIDRVERDRDGLLFENDLLQTQLHGYENHAQHHDSLMQELATLRKRLKQKEHTFDLRNLDPHQQVQAAYAVASRSQASHSFRSVQSALALASATTLTHCSMEELKEWEHLLETTLSHVRSAKEEKALEMQKKLDRQVEEQNELKLCVICLSNEKTILCLPCRHLCLCEACSRREEVTKCPICRLEIEEMLAVYS